MAIVAALGLIAACAGTPQVGGVHEPAPSSPEPAPSEPVTTGIKPFVTSGNRDMDRWRADFAERAIAQGRDEEIVYATLRKIRPLELYLGADVSIAKTGVADQAEFAKPIWKYVSDTVTTGRKTRGAERLQELSTVFDAIEDEYGVNREALTAIWAMETNLGSYIGTFDAPNTLANMAVEGRRQTFAERELIAIMKMIERGNVNRDDLISGWAGAMGQTQFMPSTFLAYAVDFDKDGKKDLWKSVPDALASAANYLKSSGYRKDEPWGIEVIAPTDFDWSLADGQDRRISTWRGRGITPMTSNDFGAADSTYAELWLPAGATGPKYLLLKNFDVYRTYNRSDSYAFAVGLLTDGVGGQSGPVTPWPTDLQLLSKQQIQTLQAELNRRGFNAGPVDGIAGRGTKGALRKFQKARGIVPADGFPSRTALDQVLNR